MLDLTDLTIGIMEQMEGIRLTYNEEASAKTFASNYMWSGPMGIKVHIEDDAYMIKNSIHGADSWNFPVGSDNAKCAILDELLRTDNSIILKLTEDDVSFLRSHYPGRYTIEEDEDASEYIYSASEHLELRGKRFGGLRKLTNKFKRTHRISSEPLTTSNMATAMGIMRSWKEGRGACGELETTGGEIDGFIADHYDELGMFGALTYVDGEPAAMTAGYRITDRTCGIAETKFLPGTSGLGYMAVEEFIRMFCGEYEYFNFEEDMGVQGMREQKRCLKPCRMNVIWNAYPKEDEIEER